MAKYYIKTNVNAYFRLDPTLLSQRIALNPTNIYWCSTIGNQRNKATKFDSYNTALFWQKKLHLAYTIMSVIYNRQHCLTLIEKSETNE